MELILAPGTFFPQLSYPTEAAFRISYGILLLAFLIMAVPHWHRFFWSELWNGYAKTIPLTAISHHPAFSVLIGMLWFACSISIIVGWQTLPIMFLNLLLARHYFIQMRWNGVLRGMGAPGFMTYWLAAAVFLLELSNRLSPAIHSLALLVLQCDFAFIMLSAGIYKFTAGYARNHGMELGMVNPEWGYWWSFYKRLPPSSLLFKILNHLAWSTEVVSAILMLIPPTRFLGGLLMLLSFIFIATQIRLGVLCEMVIVACILFFHPGSAGDQLMCSMIDAAPPVMLHLPPALSWAVQTCLWSYLLLMPLAHFGLFFNFYGRKRLPGFLQPLLERYTNFFGMIIWRVFSVDVINFFIRIYFKDANGNKRLLSRYGWQGGLRFDHVGECITITSLFTTLKYYSSNRDIFNERLLRYARTLSCPPDCIVEFEYVSIMKQPDCFSFVTAAHFDVNPRNGSVLQVTEDPTISVYKAHHASPVHEGARPGSYVPSGA